MLLPFIKSLRPSHWTKNLLLFAGLIFSLNVVQFNLVVLSIESFLIFCIITGSGYIFNDLFDLSVDRQHPKKSKRPLAAGEISPIRAGVAAGILALSGLSWAFFLNREFGFICLLYFIMTILYSIFLKHVVILDVIIIAAGFVLRALAGTVIIDVEISKWLLVCTIFLSLFLALSKRLSELNSYGKSEQVMRRILKEYNPSLLIQLISIAASSAVIAYTLYTVDSRTIENFGTINLVYTVPFVIYGIFRYMFLIHTMNLGENPERILLTDKPTLINIGLYLLAVLFILYGLSPG